MNKIIKKKCFFSATEQSGDNIGEKIIKEISLKNKYYIFDGVGGKKMSKLLNSQFYSINDFKSIGIFEIIGSLNKYINMIKKLSKIIIENNYDIVVTIDSPDFNYRLAKNIKKKGFKGKLIHIVAPTVWAWRRNRAKYFASVFDKLLVIFPFENKYFTKYNLKTKFIGHPIYYINNKNNTIKKNYIAFLPGSRYGEIVSLIQYFKVLADYLDEISSNYKIFMPTLPHLKSKLLLLTKNWKRKPIIIVNNKQIENKFSETKLAVVCSGTATLEITQRKIPQLIIYKLNFFTTIILMIFTYIKYANIINIMSNRMIIPEVINFDLTNDNILNKFKNLLFNYRINKDKQIIKSKIYLDRLILKKSPAKIASIEIKKLLLPKPFKN